MLPTHTPVLAGGAKTVTVGVAGIETLYANHMRSLSTGRQPPVGSVNGNGYRADLEEIAHMAGLQFSVNCVVNSHRELAGLFAGDPVQAHRAGVELARRVCPTELPRLAARPSRGQ